MNNFLHKKWWIILMPAGTFATFFIGGIFQEFVFIKRSTLLIYLTIPILLLLAGIINGFVNIKKFRLVFYLLAVLCILFVFSRSIGIFINNQRFFSLDAGRIYNIKENSSALKEFADEHDGNYPADLSELQKYFPERYLNTYVGDKYFQYNRIDDKHYCLYTELATRDEVFFANEKETSYGLPNCTLN